MSAKICFQSFVLEKEPRQGRRLDFEDGSLVIIEKQYTEKYSTIRKEFKHITIYHMSTENTIGKFSKLGVLVPDVLSENLKADH